MTVARWRVVVGAALLVVLGVVLSQGWEMYQHHRADHAAHHLLDLAVGIGMAQDPAWREAFQAAVAAQQPSVSPAAPLVPDPAPYSPPEGP